jgi:hypothetical protein
MHFDTNNTTNIQICLTIEESSTSIDKSKTEEYTSQEWFQLENGAFILLPVKTIWF